MSPDVSMIPAARLFARLLLRELEPPQLFELRAPEVESALAEVGMELPSAADLEDLRAEYFERFLHPASGAPPIASLWVDGQYDGDSAVALRRIARAAGCEFDAGAAAGAPVDHLGCVLLLWCQCAESAPDLADLIAREHLGWVDRALERAGDETGFYGQLSRAVAALATELRRGALATRPGEAEQGCSTGASG